MPALIDLRKRIKSVRNTQKITQAMKTVSTAKFQKAQRKVLESRPLWHGQPDLLFEMALWAPAAIHPLLERREEKRILGLVISSDKGLAGALNANLLNKVDTFFEEKSRISDVSLFPIGKKAVLHFKRSKYPVVHYQSGEVNKLTSENLKEISRILMEAYILQKADAVYIAYNEFKSILAPRVSVVRLLPIEFRGELSGILEKTKEDSPVRMEPDWDPGMASMMDAFLPQYVQQQVEHFFFESSAAEHAARMMAMDNATNNAEDLISDLTLVLNKIRQASITTELLEIMSAVEALANK
ncbi:MAG: ATP synthase F1 subunit gamma [Candidatus Aminicenantes bacterium]|nr:ATP synthase F1 subunit gamma [Candidatus Aminicenantes bacterium]